MDQLTQHIEAIIFSAEKPVTVKELLETLNNVDEGFFETETVQNILNQLSEKYLKEEFSFSLKQIAGGYQFLTKEDYHHTVSIFLKLKSRKKLSSAALETLAIVAYKQPVTKIDIEQVRGVNCDYTVNKLLEKELILIQGRAEGPGRPILYALSGTFMEYFGINGIEDLPQPKDIMPEENNAIGQAE